MHRIPPGPQQSVFKRQLKGSDGSSSVQLSGRLAQFSGAHQTFMKTLHMTYVPGTVLDTGDGTTNGGQRHGLEAPGEVSTDGRERRARA